jgi:hypothetical protein
MHATLHDPPSTGRSRRGAATLLVGVALAAQPGGAPAAQTRQPPPVSEPAGDVFASSNGARQCGYRNLRFDMWKIVDAARQYPNPRIYLVTPTEREAMQDDIATWNRRNPGALVGMAPCFNCSPELEACIVYQRGGDVFASTSRGERPPQRDGGPPADRGDRGGERESRPGRTPAPSMARCRDQVTVSDVDIQTNSGVATRAAASGMADAIDVTTGGGGRQGIQIRAVATIRPGAIPVDRIQMRFVQNVIRAGGSLSRDQASAIRLEVESARCRFPLLDTSRLDGPPPPPFYRPVVQNGLRRTPTLIDSPHLDNVRVRYPDGSRLTRVDAFWTFTAYLGCTIVDPANEASTYFEAIGSVDWRVRLAGTIAPRPGGSWVVSSDPDGSGVWADGYLESSRPPFTLAPPTYNQCAADAR